MKCDVLVIGGGASGLMAAIGAARAGRSVLVCEHNRRPGLKILASGGGRCNISNTLPANDFMAAFGRFGRFMEPALRTMGRQELQRFLAETGVETHCPDGLRVWPVGHKARTVQQGLVQALERSGAQLLTGVRVSGVVPTEGGLFRVEAGGVDYVAQKVIVATGGLSYPSLGATGDGYRIATEAGHSVASTVPAGVPLLSREGWTARLTADTVGKAELRVDLKKHSQVSGVGDLIFTKSGIAGPVALDLSGQIAALLQKYETVPLLLNLSKGRTQQDWQDIFKQWRQGGRAKQAVVELLKDEFPESLSRVLCELADVEPQTPLGQLPGERVGRLQNLLVGIPLTIVGTAGYEQAFVTKGGVRLKGVDPGTLESKIQDGLYFCGEVLDLDGPCGGFNLQWAFASGYLAGQSAASACK